MKVGKLEEKPVSRVSKEARLKFILVGGGTFLPFLISVNKCLKTSWLAGRMHGVGDFLPPKWGLSHKNLNKSFNIWKNCGPRLRETWRGRVLVRGGSEASTERSDLLPILCVIWEGLHSASCVADFFIKASQGGVKPFDFVQLLFLRVNTWNSLNSQITWHSLLLMYH